MVPCDVTLAGTLVAACAVVIQLLSIAAHDKPGACRTSLVSSEQPVLCIPVGPSYATVLTIT